MQQQRSVCTEYAVTFALAECAEEQKKALVDLLQCSELVAMFVIVGVLAAVADEVARSPAESTGSSVRRQMESGIHQKKVLAALLLMMLLRKMVVVVETNVVKVVEDQRGEKGYSAE